MKCRRDEEEKRRGAETERLSESDGELLCLNYSGVSNRKADVEAASSSNPLWTFHAVRQHCIEVRADWKVQEHSANTL